MKKILRYLFELRFLPGVSAFLFNSETWLRLLPLKRFFKIVDPENKKRIIDIGGGTGRLELALNRTDVFIYDTDEVSIDTAKQNFKNAISGNGDLSGFEDNSFDWAISVHTLEHIPGNEREKFLMEMIRISKEGIFLNFPEGEYAEKVCLNFLDRLKKNGKEPNKWTVEHLEMGIPRIEGIVNILKRQKKFVIKYFSISNYNAVNFYWTNIRASKNIIKSFFLSPIISVIKYIRYKHKPTVEIIVVGSNAEILNKFIEKL